MLAAQRGGGGGAGNAQQTCLARVEDLVTGRQQGGDHGVACLDIQHAEVDGKGGAPDVGQLVGAH